MTQKHSPCPSRSAASIFLLVALFLSGPGAGADPIGYAVGFVGGGRLVAGVEPTLFQVDLATLDAEPIGPIGPLGNGGMRLTFHADGTLYGLVSSGELSLRLVTLDPASGAAQLVGELFLDLPSFDLEGLAGDASGGLWATGIAGNGSGGFHGVIFPIDAADGSAGEPVVVQCCGPFAYAIAACGERLVMLRDELEAIDPLTGETFVLHGDAPPAQDADVGPDGGLWSLITGPIGTPVPGQGPTRVYRMDLASGAIVQVGTTALEGLAITAPTGGACPAFGATAIPTLSPWALILLLGSLALAAVVVIRRVAS